MITTEFQYSEPEKDAIAWAGSQANPYAQALVRLITRMDQEMKREIQRAQIATDYMIKMLENQK